MSKHHSSINRHVQACNDRTSRKMRRASGLRLLMAPSGTRVSCALAVPAALGLPCAPLLSPPPTSLPPRLKNAVGGSTARRRAAAVRRPACAGAEAAAMCDQAPERACTSPRHVHQAVAAALGRLGLRLPHLR